MKTTEIKAVWFGLKMDSFLLKLECAGFSAEWIEMVQNPFRVKPEAMRIRLEAIQCNADVFLSNLHPIGIKPGGALKAT